LVVFRFDVELDMMFSLLSEGWAKDDAASPSEPKCPWGSSAPFSRPSYGHSRAERRFRAGEAKIDIGDVEFL